MIDFAVLPIFFSAIFFLVISPGPDLLMLTGYASAKGFRAGVMIAVGIFLAGIVQTALVAFGLGQLMQAMPTIAVVIKLVGAVYLSWLGIKLIKSWLNLSDDVEVLEAAVQSSSCSLISKGMLNNLLNPKALLFFSLFLPQFTHDAAPISGQIVVLGMLLSSFALLINTGIVLLFSKFSKLLSTKFSAGKHADGVLGLVFLALAGRLAASN